MIHMKGENGLSPKQMRFCQEYLKDCNATQAAVRAGYSPASAGPISSKLLRKDNIQSELSRLFEAALKEAKIPLEKQIFDYWLKRAFYDITEIIGIDGAVKLSDEEIRKRGLEVCIDGIIQKTAKDGTIYIVYKFADKDDAVEHLQKYIQMIRPDVQRLDLGITGETLDRLDSIFGGGGNGR
jgi:phage terminase small subunit